MDPAHEGCEFLFLFFLCLKFENAIIIIIFSRVIDYLTWQLRILILHGFLLGSLWTGHHIKLKTYPFNTLHMCVTSNCISQQPSPLPMAVQQLFNIHHAKYCHVDDAHQQILPDYICCSQPFYVFISMFVTWKFLASL